LYLEDYYSKLPLLDEFPVKGAYHANEMAYIFGLDQPLPIVGDEEDLKFRDIYVDMMAAFIKS
uniref:COesterase domain-containing protein n=1 Tax=Steinernema glaseri TaxID=37863 RepID=A0A1I7Z6H3_9BILA